MSLVHPSADKENAQRIAVLVAYPFADTLDYLTSPQEKIKAGDIVEVPLGKKRTTGVVWDRHINLPPSLSYRKEPKPYPKEKLRFIYQKTDLPSLSPELRYFISWVAAYTFSPPGMVMAIALRPFIKGQHIQEKPEKRWTLSSSKNEDTLRLTPQREKILQSLKTHQYLSTAEIIQENNVSNGVIKGLEKLGAIKQVNLPQKRPSEEEQFETLHYQPPTLTNEQQEAAHQLRNIIKKNCFHVTLLEGVTGSGKTETYFEAIDEAIQCRRQTLVLLPEIALSAQWSERFKQRFGAQVAIWHSAQSDKNKRVIWRDVAKGKIPVVVGARSALFLPFKDLGCIIVDEEHETLFKQEEGVLYNGRDMAIVRAKYGNFPVILATATPSLETLMNVKTGRFDHLVLPKRHGKATMPDIDVIDMRNHPPPKGQFISDKLRQEIHQAIGCRQQAMLFLNRRGYAPLTLCRKCGHRLQCPYCSAWMVEHRATHTLSCHYCDYTIHTLNECPQCHAKDSLIPIGPGIERITDEARECFKDANILVMSSDTLKSASSMKEAVDKITNLEVNLIIGTQIIAKGWHFPHLTKVGVVDADLGLSGADLRAGERTLQLLHQVAGRAGRAQAPGNVLLQTYMPEHPVIEAIASGDLPQFLKEESHQRQMGHWPPWGRLAAIVISAPVEVHVEKIATDIAHHAPRVKDVQILGPAPAPIEFLRGRHRRRILVRAKRSVALQPILYHWLNDIHLSHSARLRVDIDPVSFL